MKVTIRRGTHQIGGFVTEIESNIGTKIIIDIGENLPTEDGRELPELNVEGLKEGKEDVDAIFVTHYHGDHIGLFNKISPKIPIYIGEISKQIYMMVAEKLAEAGIVSKDDIVRIKNFIGYKVKEKITIKDIVITPIEVDHSAFDAHMLLIECEGKKVLHTGDFRTHGQRGKAVIPALEKYVGKVDCLICEGTTLSREKEKHIKTEFDIQEEAEKIFKKNKYSFVMCSSTNIDRIAAIHKAAIHENRIFVCDEYQKKILTYIDNVSRSTYYKFRGKVLSYNDNIKELMGKKGFVMLVRPNYISKKVMQEFKDSVFIYSQWKGYLKEEYKKDFEYMQSFVPKDYIYLHTSGHADFESIKKVCKILKPKILIPIHGEKPEEFYNMRT